MIYEVEVFPRPPLVDAVGRGVMNQAREMHLSGIDNIAASRVYFLNTGMTAADAATVAARLLADPISELPRVRIVGQPWTVAAPEGLDTRRKLLVTRKPGVMDPIEASLISAVRDMNLAIEAAHTGWRYYVAGSLDEETLRRLGRYVLANESIEEVHPGDEPYQFRQGHLYQFRKVIVPIRDLTDAQLERLSRDGHLFLSLAEMKSVQAHFQAQGRDPVDVELETLAQTWSEHCVHKTMKGYIDFDGRMIDNLLKSTIARATRELDRDWCVSVFVDNAGVIRFDDQNNICFKVETHNHPSAIEPYGGAATGIGGCIDRKSVV